MALRQTPTKNWSKSDKNLKKLLTDELVAHDLAQDLDLLPGRFEHVVRVAGFGRPQVDDLGRKLLARFLLDAAPNRRADASVGGGTRREDFADLGHDEQNGVNIYYGVVKVVEVWLFLFF